MKTRISALLVASAALLLASTTVYADPDKDEARGKESRGYREFDDRDKRDYERDRESRRDRGGSWFHEHGYTNLGIPDGHLPPPGECRVWYPGLPPGQQPPPVKCDRVGRRVPAGAWLMHTPVAHPEHVDVTVYDSQRPGVAISVGIFDARSGALLRIEGAR